MAADGKQTTPVCKCGHPESAHPQILRPGIDYYVQTPCRATVYESVDNGPLTSGMNAWPCGCTSFVPARTG